MGGMHTKENLKFFNQHQLGFHGAFISNIFGVPLGIGLKLLGHFLNDHYAIGVGLDFGYNKKISNSLLKVLIGLFLLVFIIQSNILRKSLHK